ncbi:MAG: hypothetical protein IKR92_00765 [Alphaproteobacteria bacterium]|nr:hypothetical protein [Alphaproteobacteria bacterium]
MKSAILTLIIFIIIFIALCSGALNIIDSPVFHYLSFALLIAVFATAYFLVGFQEKDNGQSNLPAQPNSEQEIDNDK